MKEVIVSPSVLGADFLDFEKEVEKNKRKIDDITGSFDAMFDKLENTLSDINVKLARLETKLEVNENNGR